MDIACRPRQFTKTAPGAAHGERLWCVQTLWPWGARARSMTNLPPIALSVCLVVLIGVGIPVSAHAVPGVEGTARTCSAPSLAEAGFERATPSEVGMDDRALADAVALASSRLRTNVQVFRYNCLVGEGPYNEATGNTPWHLWSSTKSVVSMLAGVATTLGELDVDATIDRYLPPGQGDAAHRSITVRQLLNQSSGLAQGIVSDGIPSGLDVTVDVAAEALSRPFVTAPGQDFAYSQRGPDLLAYVVENAVGEDLQAFAQRELFSPIGITPADYHWARDRTGHTYGFALLFMPPNDFARLGMLLANDGSWNGRRIISRDYVSALREPSRTNACYGFLVWLNRTPCHGPSFPSEQTVEAPLMGPMPDDAYAMVGFLQQNNFVIPSLGVQVTWNGAFGDVSPDPATVLSASVNSELYSSFFNALAAALPDADIVPRPYRPTFNVDIDPASFLDTSDLFDSVQDLGSHSTRIPFAATPPGCLLFVCLPISPETPHRVGK